MASSVLRYGDVAGVLPYHAAFLVVAPGWRSKVLPHTHADFYELVCVVAGHGTHRVAGYDHPLCRGDVVLVRPWDRHGLAGGADGLRLINVAFPIDTWRTFTDLAALEMTSRWDRVATPPHAALEDQIRPMTASFRRVLERYQGRPRPLDLFGMWAEVLPVLAERTHGDPHGGGDVECPQWLRRACAAMGMEENLRAGLPRLLALTAVSHGHLARSLRRFYGQTPVEFVTDRRLDHAARLLASTAESVGQVADRCGFDSTSYFGRCFRRRYGASPREYRTAASRAIAPES